jgi:hypothetical protein
LLKSATVGNGGQTMVKAQTKENCSAICSMSSMLLTKGSCFAWICTKE